MMSEIMAKAETVRAPWVNGRVLTAAVAALTAVVLIGAGLFLREEQRRDVATVQAQIDLAVAARADLIQGWLAARQAAVRSLAENPTVRLFLMRAAQNAPNLELDGEAAYVRNVLTASLDLAGAAKSARGNGIPANLAPSGETGLYLLNAAGALLVASNGAPALDTEMLDRARAALRDGVPTTLDLSGAGSGSTRVGFIAPVSPVQASESASGIGGVLLTQPIGATLTALLPPPAGAPHSAEMLLLRARDEVVEALSPLADGTPSRARTVRRDTPERAEAQAVMQPGRAGRALDYRGAEVVFSSRAIPDTAWVLTYKIDAGEALADSRVRLIRLAAVLVLAVLLVLVGLAAIWRHASSRRAETAARLYRESLQKIAAQESLLRAVTDAQPDRIVIVDPEERIRFTNRSALESVGLRTPDVIGRKLVALWSVDAARRVAERNRRVLQDGKPLVAIDRHATNGGVRTLRSQHIPMPEDAGAGAGVLILEEDISEVMRERERRERVLRQMIESLVGLVDRRDPHAADHSRRVAGLARAMAERLELPAALIDTVETAGLLMNLGKVLIPRDVLLKAGELNPEERTTIRENMLLSADLVSKIEFDGPVAETLRQVHALAEDDPVLTEDVPIAAHILAVANAYVALTSPRAYRAALERDPALDVLLRQAGSRFDRRAVAALIGTVDRPEGAPRASTEAALSADL